MRILVTGATGYIAGRLIPKLLESGHSVRVLVRDEDRIRGRGWADRVEVRAGDLLEAGTLAGLCEGIDAAYYLVHSMYAGADFVRRDLRAARNFVRVARKVDLTIYLGGLLPGGTGASPHLRSRAQVGALLREALPTTELRAGPIIGSGSASFELVRYLTERHPLMLVPSCMKNEVQPVALIDVLSYLLEALGRDPLGVIEIGGNRLSFVQMIQGYASLRGLSRRIAAMPLVTPRVVATWAAVATPIPYRLARPLLQGMLQPVVADTRKAAACFPDLRPISYPRAVELALQRIEEGKVATAWTGALGSGPTRELLDTQGTIQEVRTHYVAAGADRIHDIVSTLGGDRGWLVWNRVWWVRGLIDRLLGGPGLRRGRRHPRDLLAGEAVDFWRVERTERPRLLRLRAEMKVPGRAWLQWEMFPHSKGSRLVQTALFVPRGLGGILYWYLLYPIHAVVFSALARAVARNAETAAGSEATAGNRAGGGCRVPPRHEHGLLRHRIRHPTSADATSPTRREAPRPTGTRRRSPRR